MQNHSKDFYQMNAGAHRRRATNFGAPALTWHRAFWINVPYSQDFPNFTIADLEAKREEARIDLKNKIDEFIVRFRNFVLTGARIGGTPRCQIHPTVGAKTFLFNRVVDSTDLTPITNYDDLTEAQREVLNDVLYSDNRVVVIEFNWEGIAATARIEFHTEYFSITTIAELKAVSGDMTEYGELVAYLQSVNKRPSPADIVQADGLRKFFFFDFWDHRVALMAEDTALRDILTDDAFQNLFADFRGLVISNMTFKLQNEPEFGQSEGLAWGKQIDFKLLPLFTEAKNYECTASYMLDGRALYMTTLGPQLPEAQDWDLLPLQYIFYVHESDHQTGRHTIVSKWQLGRLVDRVHLLGTVRLASLKYLPQLREASTSLAGFDGYAKEARDDRTGGISVRSLRRAHLQLANIAAKFGELTKTDTGMSYRVERSRYYVEQFNANLETLRIRRLEGYQRYDEFVRHRLGPVFDFIHRLGIRRERAINALSLLDQFQIDEDIRTIQAYGEVVLFGALVPYYLTNLAEHLVAPEWMKAFATTLFILSLGVAAWRYSVFKERDRIGQLAAFSFGALVAAGAIAALQLLHIGKTAEQTEPTPVKYLLPTAPTPAHADEVKPAPPPHVTKVKQWQTRRSRHAR
jgi:hypothetical protein